MKRTTIMLPEDIKARAFKRASKMGISLAAFIRQSIERSLQNSSTEWSRHEEDPFFSDDTIFLGKVPDDTALHHDDYLYGDKV